MALTYGFYNSIEGDRVYDAIQFGRIFDGIIKDGVYATYEKGMMVIASSNPAEVIIQPGRAWFNPTWSYNDANVIFEAPAPEVLLERYDALVLEINEELSSRENSFKWVQGTPSSRPERPTLTNTSTIHQYPLCYVHRYPETTMIYTRDITNMIGTSECPFATGVLEGIDLDAWINQWDDEFHTWENSKKTQFEAWMLSQETAFTTWYNAFKNQMEADVQEVEDFVDYLESVLDASTAIHLQEEIDELKNEISSGSHITVTTINPELYGRNVTITEAGGTVFTEKFDNTGVAVFKSVPYVGNLAISSTYGTQTAERVVNTPYYARYEFAIAFWAATVNIIGDPEMSGSSVTVKDSNETVVGSVVLDNLGTGVYTAIKPDTYKFTLTYGGETMEVTLSVTQETTYTVDLHATSFKWQDWLEAGGVTGSYSSLDDVLADKVALRRLFTVHASVDYMASIDKENEDVETIIGTDLAAKWINLRDYALDTLYANEIIAGYMDEADKYFYGEWVLMPQVPTMTSNTAPYGEAIGVGGQFPDSDNRYNYYAPFKGDISGNYRWMTTSQNTSFNNIAVGYHFVSPILVRSAHIRYGNAATYNYQIQGSNDGFVNDVTILASGTHTVTSSDTLREYAIDFDNSNEYSYVRYFIVSETLPSAYYGGNICALQFYAWAPKGNVPIMTSATAPYGEVKASSYYDSHYLPYYAFNDDLTNYWYSSNGATNNYLEYDFVSPIAPKKASITMMIGPSSGKTVPARTFSIQGFNGTEWVTLGTFSTQATASSITDTFEVDLETDTYYLQLRAFCADVVFSNSNYSFAIKQIQFYGRELSVSVPTMTGNTTPYGEASASNTYDIYYPWKAFDRANGNGWFAYAKDEWVEYDFKKPVKVEMITYGGKGPGSKAVTTYPKFQGYDGTDWIDLTNEIEFTMAAASFVLDKVATMIASGSYRKYRMTLSRESSNHDGNGFKAQFYGKDYSEKEFEADTTKKWLYDHGVELETFTDVTQSGDTTSTITREADCIKINAPTRAQLTSPYAYAIVDLTSYNLVRGKMGMEGYSSSDQTDVGGGYWIFNSNGSTVLAAVANKTTNAPNNFSLDVSAINETSRVGIVASHGQNQSSYSTFKELWLE